MGGACINAVLGEGGRVEKEPIPGHGVPIEAEEMKALKHTI